MVSKLNFDEAALKPSKKWIALVWLWMLMLHCFAYAEESMWKNRQVILDQIVDLDLSTFIPLPEIKVEAHYLKLEEIPKSLRKLKEFELFNEIFTLGTKDAVASYVKLDRFVKRYSQSDLMPWAMALRADLLYRAQTALKEPKYNLILEDYQDFILQYPKHEQMGRALYQVALTQLAMEFYNGVEDTVRRGIKEVPESPLLPYFYFMSGEQAFRNRDWLKAEAEYGVVVQRFPQSDAAIEAAYRRSFIMFKTKRFKDALAMYKVMENYHPEIMKDLKLQTAPSSKSKFIDRVYYAETVFLTGDYDQAAKLFEGLANIFPKTLEASLLLGRFAETFFRRGKIESAEKLFDFALSRAREQSLGQAWLQMKLAEMKMKQNSVRSDKEAEELLKLGYERALHANHEALAAVIVLKLAALQLNVGAIAKGKSTLEIFVNRFETNENKAVASSWFIRTLELEILDYYQAGDYLAALSVFLTHEKKHLQSFHDTQVLLRLADAALALKLVDKASSILNRVVYLEQNNIGRQEALLKLTEILIRKKDLAKASERLRRFNFAYPLTPFQYQYEKLWGDLYLAMNQREKAASHYERSLELAKVSPDQQFELRELLATLAEIYDGMSLPVKAIETYEAYIRLLDTHSPQSLQKNRISAKDLHSQKMAFSRIADLYFSMQDYLRALNSYQRLAEKIKEEPFQSHALYRVGECYLYLNDRKAAIESFKKIQSKGESNLWAKASKAYIQSVELEEKHGIRIFN